MPRRAIPRQPVDAARCVCPQDRPGRDFIAIPQQEVATTTMTQDTRSPFSFGRSGSTPAPRPSMDDAEYEATAPAVGSRSESLVDASSTFDGHITTEGDIRIQGLVSGEITCRGLLTIEEQATARARIETRDAEVLGTVEGDISCSGRLHLSPTAVVTGTIRTRTLVVQEGASINGSIETNAAGDLATRSTSRRSSSTSLRKEEEESAGDDDEKSSDTVGSRRARSRDLPSFALVSSDESSSGGGSRSASSGAS